MKYFDYSFTRNDWELGLGFNLPCKSQIPVFGYKVHHHVGFRLFIGPFTLELGREKEYFVGDNDSPTYITELQAQQYREQNRFQQAREVQADVLIHDHELALAYKEALAKLFHNVHVIRDMDTSSRAASEVMKLLYDVDI